MSANLPGLQKEDLSINVDDGGNLTITGAKTEQKSEEGVTWHRRERASGSFTRTIPVNQLTRKGV